MGAGYGLAPSSQAAPLVADGRLIDLAPDQPMRVRLYWHRWELEPPLAQQITQLIVSTARGVLVQDGVEEPEVQPMDAADQPPVPGDRRAQAAPTASPTATTNEIPKPASSATRSASPVGFQPAQPTA